jgi:predicted ATPase
VLSVEQIDARLDDAFHLLTGGSRTAVPRQQALRATLDWSLDLLSQEEKVLFRRLSVFAGGFTLEATEEICSGEGIKKDHTHRGATRRAALERTDASGHRRAVEQGDRAIRAPAGLGQTTSRR